MNFAEVVINRPIEGPFTYSITESLREDVKIGGIVEISFGNKIVIGYVVNLSNNCSIKNIKPISKVIDKSLIVEPEILELTKWISEYYCSSWGEAISAAIPGVLKKSRKKETRNQRTETEKEKEYEFIDGSSEHLEPTPEQKEALDSIIGSMDKRTHKIFLLYGVTGSGKTEVYLKSIAHALELGLSSIILVPEISLTPKTVARFKARFGDKIAVLH